VSMQNITMNEYFCKPTTIVLLFSLLLATVAHADTGDAINIDVRIEGIAVIIYYDLIPFNDKGRYDVSLQISTDGGRTFESPSEFITGDIGKNIYPGMRKRIIWYPNRDYFDPIGPERYTFDIITIRKGGSRNILYAIIGAVVAGGGTAAYFLFSGDEETGFPKPPDRPGN
jgi:hypothetical protein